MNTPQTVHCPTCQKPVSWTPKAKWKPFCSERCRLIDLGAWISEGYRIPSNDNDNDNTHDTDEDLS